MHRCKFTCVHKLFLGIPVFDGRAATLRATSRAREVAPLLLFAMVETRRVLGTNRRGGPNFRGLFVCFLSVPRSASRSTHMCHGRRGFRGIFIGGYIFVRGRCSREETEDKTSQLYSASYFCLPFKMCGIEFMWSVPISDKLGGGGIPA